MKKLLMLILTIATIFSCGCKKKQNEGKEIATERPKETTLTTKNPAETDGTDIPASEDLSEEATAGHTIKPDEEDGFTRADEFIINEDSDGNQILRLYRSENSVIRLKETYNGKPYFIGDAAFVGKEMIEEIYLHDKVEYIQAMLFWNCSNLKKVDVGDSVKSIGACAFYDCAKLEKVILSDCVEKLGAYFLKGTTSLKSIYIPSSVTDIDPRAFVGANEDLIIQGKFASPIYYFALANNLIFVVK